MTELTIRPEEIRDAIERNVAAYSPGTAREEVGRVIETGDGIARVEGLHSAMTNELLEFEGGLLGVALNLDVREIGVVLLGDGSRIEEGQAVNITVSNGKEQTIVPDLVDLKSKADADLAVEAARPFGPLHPDADPRLAP